MIILTDYKLWRKLIALQTIIKTTIKYYRPWRSLWDRRYAYLPGKFRKER